jgi:hypothetical protein
MKHHHRIHFGASALLLGLLPVALQATTVDFNFSPAVANNVQLPDFTLASNAAADGSGWTTSDGTGTTPNIALQWFPAGTNATGENTLEVHSSTTFINAGFTVPIVQFDMNNQVVNGASVSPPDPMIDFTVGNGSSLKVISMELGNASDQTEAPYRWIVSLVRLSDMATVMVQSTGFMGPTNRETLTFNFQGLPNESYRLHFFDENVNRLRTGFDNLKFSEVPLPQTAHLATNALDATTYTFTFNDGANSSVDLAAARQLLIDDVPVAATFTKAGSVTTVTHMPPVPPQPGSQHKYNITVTDSNGSPVQRESVLRAPWQSNQQGGGNWTTEMVWTRSATSISNYTAAETVLADAATYPAEDRISGARTNFIHFDDIPPAPLHNSLSTPYPLFDPVNGGPGRGLHADFAMRSTGRISIRNGGKCWFLLNSDDGFAFRVDGILVASLGTRVRLNSLIPVDLAAGPHDIEVVHFNRGSYAGISLYLLKGISDDPPPVWEQSFELLRPVPQSAEIEILAYNYVADIHTMYLSFSSQAGSTYALEYSGGMAGPEAPAELRWHTVPGYGAIAGQPNSTTIAPLDTSILETPSGALPNDDRCFFRVRRL